MIKITLESEGRVGVIVLHGLFFRGVAEGKICRKMLEDNLLEAVIGLFANLLFCTGIPAVRKKIERIEKEPAETREKMHNYLVELGL